MTSAIDPDAHVVVASAPGDLDGVVGPKLYAVVAGSTEAAEAAVQAIVADDVVVTTAGGPLMAATVAGLDLRPGEVKQIG